MAAKITTIADLFHRFHQCEMQLKQGKIAACLITFREVIEKLPAIPKTEKEKSELHGGIDLFLRNLSTHKKFREIFGNVSFDDSDLETNLEFIKSMIIAQEEEIIERVKKEEEALEAHRLEIEEDHQKHQEELRKKIEQAIGYLDQNDVPKAMEIIDSDDEIREAVTLYYNEAGMHKRVDKDFDTAIDNYKKALIVSPEDENLHYNMGRAHLEAGRHDRAMECLAQAMNINPDFNEGKIFYHYLLKLKRPEHKAPVESHKSSGLIKKLLGK